MTSQPQPPQPISDALWLHGFTANAEPEDIDAYQHQQRPAKWRVEPDGMTTFTPAPLTTSRCSTNHVLDHDHHAKPTPTIMRSRPRPSHTGDWPTAAQQQADAIETLLSDGTGTIDTEIVLHIDGAGNPLDDRTPISDTAGSGNLGQSATTSPTNSTTDC